jgi:L-asparaginase
MKIHFIATGGTIDKIYYDRKNDYGIGDPQIVEVLKGANVTFEYEVISLLKKDSLDLTDADREKIRIAVREQDCRRVVVTHGTDTMIQTARVLKTIPGKVMVLTGSMQPARFAVTDAIFNIGCAVTAVQTLPDGVYIAMNGQVFDPERSWKNVEENRFEALDLHNDAKQPGL